jgi:hypothetical protein
MTAPAMPSSRAGSPARMDQERHIADQDGAEAMLGLGDIIYIPTLGDRPCIPA